jgi:hypothetical protein
MKAGAAFGRYTPAGTEPGRYVVPARSRGTAGGVQLNLR